jgi:hypothetical protein
MGVRGDFRGAIELGVDELGAAELEVDEIVADELGMAGNW